MKKYMSLLEKANQERFAIPQFNINNLEWAKYILEACEEDKSPVFLGVSTGAAKYMGGYNVVVGMVRGLIKDLKITIPVMIHLDHGSSVEECKKAYDAGFDSIMIDASLEPLDENIKATNEVSSYCSDAIIEAELGIISGTEDTIIEEHQYTTTEEAIKFCSSVDIDMLAPSLGSVHGLYKAEPKMNYQVMKEIKAAVNKPLVLHGGSGLSESILKESIASGVRKLNVNTELQVAWSNAVRDFIFNKDNATIYDPRKVISSGENTLKEAVHKYIDILGSKNKG